MLPSVALAQRLRREAPHPGSTELDIGVLWTGGYSAGTIPATETSNPSVSPTPLTLFKTDERLAGGIGADARIGVYLSRKWAVEGGLQFSRPKLIARTTGDFESAPDTSVEEVVTQYLVDGSLLYQFASLANGRGAPFISGGGGYFRQLDAGGVSVQTGNEIHGGAGLRYWFGHGIHRFGLRVESRVSARSGSVDLQNANKRRIVPTVSAGLAYLF